MKEKPIRDATGKPAWLHVHTVAARTHQQPTH